MQNTNRNRTLIIVVVVVALLILGGVWFWVQGRQSNNAAINSFQDCANAGHPIMESSPEQCKTPDGRTFVNQIETEEKLKEE